MKTKLLLASLMLSMSLSLFADSGRFGVNGTNLLWITSNNNRTLTISGTGAMEDFTSSSLAPWYDKHHSYITSIIISDGVTNIGDWAFFGCYKMTSITIPNSVTSIGDNAFTLCYGMTSITTIPNSVTSIGEGAFSGCRSLTSVTIPNSVTSIGKMAFSDCGSLPVIDNIRYADTYLVEAVDKTSSSYSIKDGTRWIAEEAFRECSSLTSIIIPNSVTSIGDYSFSGCSSLNSVTIPNSVISIGDYSFSGCSSLNSVTIPNNVISIGDYSFFGCSSLTSVTIPKSVTNIADYAFSSCSSLTSVTIPNSITTIGNYAFSSCSSLTSVTIPNSVTSIGDCAYYACSSLTKAVIGDGVMSIGASAFNSCTYLEEIVIGNGVTTDGISSSAFAKCPYLLSVTCKALFPPVINSNVFTGCGVLSGVDLYVPEESVKRYKKADVWSEFNIVGKDLGTDDPTNPTTDQFTITWQDENGNILKTDQVENGTTPAYTGTTPTKEGYDFIGWLPNIKPATENTKYTTYFIPQTQAEEKVYTVNINGENCSLNINNQYPEGTVITIEAVADECFEFQQWSDGNKDNPRTVTVTKDMNLTAEFNKLRYTITGEVDSSKGGKVQIIKK